jgi:LuxR family maltose regulon positive regulatory protein
MPEDDLILQTKLIAPQIKGRILRRERLLNLLKENLDKKLILICGGAGYGKTTLLGQVLSEINDEYVYYSVNPSDRDPNNFFNHLIFGLKKYYSKFGQRTKNILDESSNFNLNTERILSTFINEALLLKNHIIILDDFHAIKKADWIKSTFEYLLTYLPSNTHFIISTRELPDFNLVRLLAKQELFTITKEDLRFTDEEVSQLLTKIFSLKISDEQFKRLIDVSKGWITGIQLIMPRRPDEEKLKKALNGFLSSNVPLFEYFANEIFINEDKRIQKFLASTAILDEIYPEYCNAIMQITNSLRILRKLKKRNIFITLVGIDKNHFRFHPLFRKYLLHQLEKELKKSKIASLYKRIGKFLERSGRIESAIEYYIRGSKYKPASRLIERHANQIVRQGKLKSLQDWLSRISESTFASRPWLNYYKALLLDRMANQLDEAIRIYRNTRRLFRKSKDRKGLTKTYLEIAIILCRKGAIKEAKRELQKAEKYCPASDILLRIQIYNVKGSISLSLEEYGKGKRYLLKMLDLSHRLKNPSPLMLTHCNLGVFYFEEGDFNAAEREFDEAFKILSKGGSLGRIGVLYANAASVKILKGNLENAEILLKKGLDICHKYNEKYSLISVMVVLGNLYSAQGNIEHALEYYNQALALLIETGEERRRKKVIESIVQLYLSQKDLNRAKEYFVLLNGGVLNKENIYLNPSWAVLESEIKIAEGKNELAIKSLKKLLRIIQKKQHHFLIFKANLSLSILYESLGKRYSQHLNVALNNSKKYGYERVILQNSQFLALLKKEVEKGRRNDYIDTILSQAKIKPLFPKQTKSFKIRVNFFGTPEIFRDGELIANWVSKKAMKLFCFFVMNRERRINKDEIIKFFWPDWDNVRAEKNLFTTLYYIRRTLMPKGRQRYAKEVILYQNQTYTMDPTLQIETDIKKFENIANEIKVKKSFEKRITKDSLNKAISLYRGLFCSGWHDPWVETYSAVYENLYLKILSLAADDAFSSAYFEESLNYCKKIVAVDRYREEIYRLLIKSLLNLGRIGEAIDYCERLNKALFEIKISPASETSALIKELLPR